MKQIIRIDKGDGRESVELDFTRVHQTINTFNPLMQEAVMQDFVAGTRTVENEFAVYEMRDLEPANVTETSENTQATESTK